MMNLAQPLSTGNASELAMERLVVNQESTSLWSCAIRELSLVDF